MQEVARKFEAEYIKDSDGLNVKRHLPCAPALPSISGEIIHIVKDLVDSGHAVARNGDVYFRVKLTPATAS